jgi:hypothetical protein
MPPAPANPVVHTSLTELDLSNIDDAAMSLISAPSLKSLRISDFGLLRSLPRFVGVATGLKKLELNRGVVPPDLVLPSTVTHLAASRLSDGSLKALLGSCALLKPPFDLNFEPYGAPPLKTDQLTMVCACLPPATSSLSLAFLSSSLASSASIRALAAALVPHPSLKRLVIGRQSVPIPRK